MRYGNLRLSGMASLALVLWGFLGGAEVRADPPDLKGHYRVEGTTPDGKPYTQHVHIRKKGEFTYHVKWTNPDDGDYMTEGVGVLKDGMLAVAWSGSTKGVMLYAVENKDGKPKLVGRWTYIDSDGKAGHEVLHYIP
jgi:hypothetical protein